MTQITTQVTTTDKRGTTQTSMGNSRVLFPSKTPAGERRPKTSRLSRNASDLGRCGVEEGRRRQQESGGELPKVSRASLSGASVCAELVPTAEIHREGSNKLSLRDSDQLSGAFTRL
ncbi:hypothetical protein Bbelb_443290 [Branchiostoma belcheri]|nr:hypothetical protein Bbelb_443290 [Branchiostoma belcheri]